MLFYLSKKNSNKIYRLVKEKKLKKIYWWVYSDEIEKESEKIFRENIEDILYKTYFIWDWNKYCEITKLWQIENTWKYDLENLKNNNKNFYISELSSLYWIFNNNFFIRSNFSFKKNIHWISIISQKFSQNSHNQQLERFWNTYKTNLESTILDLFSEKFNLEKYNINLYEIVNNFYFDINKDKIRKLWKNRKVVYHKFLQIYKQIKNEKEIIEKENKYEKINTFNWSNYFEKLTYLNTLISCFKWWIKDQNFQKYNVNFENNESLKESTKILYLLTFKYFQEYYKINWWVFSKEVFAQDLKENNQKLYTNFLWLEKIMISKINIFKNINSEENFIKYYIWIWKWLFKNDFESDQIYLKEMFQVIKNRKLSWIDKIFWMWLIALLDEKLWIEQRKILFLLLTNIQTYWELWYLIDLSQFYHKINTIIENNDISILWTQKILNLFFQNSN